MSDTAAIISALLQNNSADLQPIIAQCGGYLQFMSLFPHVEAIMSTVNATPGDPAGAVQNVVHKNEQSVRVIFQMIGGLDGLIKLTPNFINIYRTIEKTQSPVINVVAHLSENPHSLKG